MNELMARIGFPVDRLPSTCNHDAWPQPCRGSFHFHCGGQMHRAGYPAQNALSMIVQLQELPYHCLAAQINRSIQLRMMIAGAAGLHKLNPSLEMIHHLLISITVPPLDRDFVPATGEDDPKGDFAPGQFMHCGSPALFRVRQVDVAFELRASNVQPQLSVQTIDESVQRMIGDFVCPIDQRKIAIECLHLRIVFRQMTQIGIVVPQFAARRPNIRDERPGITSVQVTNCSRQKHDVAEGEIGFENQLPHRPQVSPTPKTSRRCARLRRAVCSAPPHRGPARPETK
jgi:hypothetical protein